MLYFKLYIGWMLAMVFNLVWLDACKAISSPLEFPAFLRARNELNETLFSWASFPSENRGILTDMTCEIGPLTNLQMLKPNQISDEKMEVDSGWYLKNSYLIFWNL